MAALRAAFLGVVALLVRYFDDLACRSFFPVCLALVWRRAAFARPDRLFLIFFAMVFVLDVYGPLAG